MSAVHGLQVHLRVPVGVVDDDDVGRREVDAEPAGACRQHEHELFTALRVVLLDLPVAVLVRRLTVQTTVLNTNYVIVIFIIPSRMVYGRDSTIF